LAAVGRAGITSFNVGTVDLYLDDICIVKAGGRADGYTEEQGRRVMTHSEITIRIELHRGGVNGRVWTCDFSYDYVKINAEYRS
ncbi:MAG: argJ, partial [Halothiobacillaceae bacterium]